MSDVGKKLLAGLHTRGADLWRSRRYRVLVGVLLFLFLVSCYVFVELADEVTEGSTRQFDEWSVRALRRDDDPAMPLGPSWLREAGMDATALGSPLILSLTVAGAVGFLIIRNEKWLAVTTVVMTAGGALVTLILKYVIGRPRPSIVPHLREITTPSFPSGHAMLSALVFLTIGVILARSFQGRWVKTYILLWGVFLTFIVGASRVYLGVHYPTDVLGGWLAGFAWAIVCWGIIHFVPSSASSTRKVDTCG